jgi:ribosomal protein L37E
MFTAPARRQPIIWARLRSEQSSSDDAAMKGKKPELPCRRCGHFEWTEKTNSWECANCGIAMMRSDFLGKPSKGSKDAE